MCRVWGLSLHPHICMQLVPQRSLKEFPATAHGHVATWLHTQLGCAARHRCLPPPDLRRCCVLPSSQLAVPQRPRPERLLIRQHVSGMSVGRLDVLSLPCLGRPVDSGSAAAQGALLPCCRPSEPGPSEAGSPPPSSPTTGRTRVSDATDPGGTE